MGTLGRNVLSYRSGYDDSIIAAGDPDWMLVGATIDWAMVAAAPADITLPSGRLIKQGQKYLRNGQGMARIGGAGATASVVATIAPTPTGGSFKVQVTQAGQTFITPIISYNGDGAAVQVSVRALDARFLTATVTGAASGPYTFTYPASLGSVQTTLDTALLTGTGTPTATYNVTGTGRSGWFAPYDPAATDGRAVLTRGDFGLVERTVVKDGTLGLGERDDQHLGLIIGGHVWEGRIIQSGAAAHSLAAGPTRAELLGVLPELFLVKRTY